MARGRRSSPPSSRRARGRRHAQVPDGVAEAGDGVPRRSVRAVVDDDDLRRGACLADGAADRLGERCRAAKGWDDHGDVGGHSLGSIATRTRVAGGRAHVRAGGFAGPEARASARSPGAPSDRTGPARSCGVPVATMCRGALTGHQAGQNNGARRFENVFRVTKDSCHGLGWASPLTLWQ